MESTEARLGPSAVFQGLAACQETEALRAAIEIDLFTALGAGAATAKEIAARCNASERGVRTLADYLVVNGFLGKDGGRYALAPVAAMFLDRSSPGCIASAIHFMASPHVMRGFAQLTTTVRTGRAAIGDEGLAPDHPMWVEFARSMAPLARLMAELLAGLLDAAAGRPWKGLDIAAGHGLFGITLARDNPKAQIGAVAAAGGDRLPLSAHGTPPLDAGIERAYAGLSSFPVPPRDVRSGHAAGRILRARRRRLGPRRPGPGIHPHGCAAVLRRAQGPL